MVRHRFSCQADRLKGLLSGRLTRQEETELDAHLGGCADCREALEAMAADGCWWAELPRLGEHDPEEDGGPRAGRDDDLGFLEPSDTPGSLGRLGPYEVAGVLGRGGMGVVLRAFDTALHRPVAIKVIAPQLATSAPARRRFAREARAAAAVAHDHVVAIHAVAESPGGLPYLVMPYIPGRSLQERLDHSGPLGVAEILRIGVQTASGLAAAHAQGLVHRDIKPANILLENGVERVKITDFGLARVADEANQSHSGFIAGTPQYMAPEQANGEPIDARADLFSLGSVLYAAATGHSPFRAATTVAVLRRVCEDRPRPIREINPEIPGWLAAIIARLHAKDPADRFATAAEVAALLGRCLAYLERPDGAPPPYLPARESGPTRRRLGRGPTAALVIALAGLVAAEATGRGPLWYVLAAVHGTGTPERTPVADIDDPGLEGGADEHGLGISGPGPEELRMSIGPHRISASSEEGTVRDDHAAIEKDQRRTVSVRHESHMRQGPTSTRRQDARTNIVVPHNYRPGPPRQSESTLSVVAAGPEVPGAGPERLLRPVPLDDRSPAPLWPGEAITFMAYSADGNLLAMASNLDRKILVFELPARRLRGSLTGHSARVMELAFSPDGTRLAAATGHWGFSARSGEVCLWELAKPGDPAVRVAAGIPMVFTVAFSPDGNTLAYGGWDDAISLYDLAAGKVRAVCRGHQEKVRSVAFTPDGRRLASGGADRTVRLWDPDTGRLLGDPFPPLHDEVGTVDFSPDGTLLAAHSIRGLHPSAGESGGGQIKVWDVSSRDEKASLAAHPDEVWHLAFAPDGKTLASAGGVANRSGEVVLWDVATWTPRTTLDGFPSNIECVAYSPDSKTLMAVTSHLGIRSEVRVWDLVPPIGPIRQFPVEGEPNACKVWSIAFAPGGKTLAIGVGDWLRHGRLLLWDPESGAAALAHRTRLGVRALAYARAGDHLALGTFDGTLLVCDAEGRESRQLEGHGVSINALAIAPDGTLMATAAQDGTTRLWDVESGHPARRFDLKHEEVWSLAFSPDGATLAAGFKNGAVALLDVARGVERRRLLGHGLGVGGVAYTPDGTKLVSGGWDRTVRIWDAESGECLATLEGHEHPVTSVAVAPDGRLAATGEGSENDPRARASLLFWDLRSNVLRSRLSAHPRRIWSVAFSPDGKTVASGGEDGRVKLWDVNRVGRE